MKKLKKDDKKYRLPERLKRLLNINLISLHSAIFLCAVFIFYWFVIPFNFRKYFLLAGSFFFIFLIGSLYAVYFLFNIRLTYLAGGYIGKCAKNSEKKIVLKLILIWLVSNLCFFKYINSFWDIFKLKIQFVRIEIPHIIFPLGLSYVTFKLIHYIFEIYRKRINRGAFIDFALYVLFFPTFLAGPVERFERFYPQISENKYLDSSNVNYGLFRIICGIIKKNIVADSLAKLILPVLCSPGQYQRAVIIFAIYGLAVRIYMDFSGYTDIAIGIARLFGYKIVENFNNPFFKRNIALFWRNWHISVYSWIRDYFFFPLFGSRTCSVKLYLGIFISMVVFNLWHNATIGFLILGCYHGSGLIIWQLWQTMKKKSAVLKRVIYYRWWEPVSIFATFNFVSFGFIFFNVDFKNIKNILGALF